MSETVVDYTPCFEDLEAALADPKGIRIPFTERGDAIQYRLRLNKARRKDRHDNKELDFEHPLHGRSVYDRLVFRINNTKRQLYLYIEQSSRGEAQPLSEVEDERSDEGYPRPIGAETESEAAKALAVEATPVSRRRL